MLHNLASPQTGLGQLFIAFDKTAKEVAPVAETNASFFRDLDTFFTAFAGASSSLERTIEGGPAALPRRSTRCPSRSRRSRRPPRSCTCCDRARGSCATVAAPLGHAFAVGAVNLRAATSLNRQLASALQALEVFAKDPVVSLGLEEFTRTAQLGNPLLEGIAPAQATCNYPTLAFRNVANLLAESVGNGTLARVGGALSPAGPTTRASQSAAPANGGSQDAKPDNGKPARSFPTTTCTTTPTPTWQAPASRGSAKRATCTTSPARW